MVFQGAQTSGSDLLGLGVFTPDHPDPCHDRFAWSTKLTKDFCLPEPSTSSRLQPRDVSIHSPLKRSFGVCMNHPDRGSWHMCVCMWRWGLLGEGHDGRHSQAARVMNTAEHMQCAACVSAPAEV